MLCVCLQNTAVCATISSRHAAPIRRFASSVSGFLLRPAAERSVGQTEGKHERGCARCSQQCTATAGKRHQWNMLFINAPASQTHASCTADRQRGRGSDVSARFCRLLFSLRQSVPMFQTNGAHMPNVHCTISSSPRCQFQC